MKIMSLLGTINAKLFPPNSPFIFIKQIIIELNFNFLIHLIYFRYSRINFAKFIQWNYGKQISLFKFFYLMKINFFFLQIYFLI